VTPATDDAPLFGSPAEIVERLTALESAGVGYVLVSDPAGNLDTLRTFAAEVMPQFGEQARRERVAVAA
jgi:alkanesulfonate monooxygenase SsuD/methylene tetrahydromethanopterin reductase-like flavin-dependent oxidoreductase (luciferase family)